MKLPAVGNMLCLGRICLNALLSVVILGGSSDALAAELDSTYCERVRADATSDASLLLAPRLNLQALRLPTQRGMEPAELVGGDAEFQLRASVSWSAANAWAGLLTLQQAEANCERHAAQSALSEVIRAGSELGSEPALRMALEFLDGKRALVERIEEQAKVRHARHLTNLAEYDQVQSLVLQIERKRLDLARQLDRVEGEGTVPVAPVEELVSSYARASDRYEEAGSDLRSVRKWDLSFRAGVIPASEPDYFGAVELSYNLGGLFQAAAERRYLAARSAEVRQARHELPSQAARLERQLARNDEILRQELDLRERELQLLERQIGLVERSSSPGRKEALAVAELRRLLVQADLIYTRELLARRGELDGSE